MMTVKEYSQDVNKSVEDIIKLGKMFDLVFEDEDYMLSQDDIILLDNNLKLIDEAVEEEVVVTEEESSDDIEFLENKFFEEEESKISKVSAKKIKQKHKASKEDKKMMYKSKEKLITNTVEQEEVVLTDEEVAFRENMTIGEFAEVLGISATQIIKSLMQQGIIATINNSISLEAAEKIALEHDKIIKEIKELSEADFDEIVFEDSNESVVERAPIITIMGHVDHGKTTLLDNLRKSSIVDDEAGGITQHIGAYQVEHNNHKLTFLDTPGHEAFTQMRSRGASVTDIVIIVVAADDGVKPQTIEAIDHAKASSSPIIIAVNKIDLPNSNVERVKQELSQHNIISEDWGGDIIFTEISAKFGDNIDKLLDNILLVAELEELKANPARYAMGTVIESRVDKGKGVVATLLVQNGTLRLGDPVVVGSSYGKIRTMHDSHGHEMLQAEPSTPIEITGLSATPSAGDKFMAFENEKKAKQIAAEREKLMNERNKVVSKPVTLDSLFEKIQEQKLKELHIVLKTDVHGSAEAVKSSIEGLKIGDVVINVVRSSVGAISESDVLLATASNALIIGFNVRPNASAKQKAQEEGIEIKTYNIIYKIVEDLEQAMKGMLDPEFEEIVTGQVEIRETIKASKVGTIGGCYVTDGVIKRESLIRLIRDGIVIYEGVLSSLKRFKDDVKEVKNGYECGLTIKNYNDIKVGDVIEAYEMKQIKVV